MKFKVPFLLVLAILASSHLSAQSQNPYSMLEDQNFLQYQQSMDEQLGSSDQTAQGQPVSATQTAKPVSSVGPQVRQKLVPGLSGRDEGMISMLSADIAGQILVYLYSQQGGPYSLQIQSGSPGNQAMLDLLLYAFESGQSVNIGYGFNREIIDLEMRK
jgi:hypothetical protein